MARKIAYRKSMTNETQIKGVWSKVQDNTTTSPTVMYVYACGSAVEVYDEQALRSNLRKFLSDESYSRYTKENGFCTPAMFYRSLEWFVEGLKLFYIE